MERIPYPSDLTEAEGIERSKKQAIHRNWQDFFFSPLLLLTLQNS
jgi:hypothetical protein